jgi:hypothetical protein
MSIMTGKVFGYRWDKQQEELLALGMTKNILNLYKNTPVWVKDRKWAEDQKIKEAGDGVIITFTSTQFEKVVEWALFCGRTALPLEPESLVDAWRQNIEEMQKMAGKK